MSTAASATARCGPRSKFCRKARFGRIGMGGFPVRNVERLCLAHFWVAFAAFLVAALLGTWQMWVRSPLGANIGTPGQYFLSVTAHGVSMAYVLTTFFIMGFGYFVAVTALARPLPGKAWAWGAFWLAVAGVVMAVVTILTGQASVLFTFYPPLTASPWFYIGLVLVRADACCDAGLEAGKPRPPRSARNVCHRRQRRHVAVDHGRRGGRAVVPGDPGGVRLGPDDRRRACTYAVLLDAPRHRLFLADPRLYRLLHHGAAGSRRPALQRHVGPPHLHSVPHLQPAGRDAPPADGSRARQRHQVHSDAAHGLRFGADL